ncbi:hypothetical protein E8E13_000858 [Curvularia kusanoi]|uniref:Rhodopsin domain-containing protein n=1 Tax=Curvularia kusanoi TaxID=90978 RepID=A0A9P4W5S4_CURKU|nr:hypothetical protein E8E13_000858 [Curvularia kusanoi]
MAPNFTLFYGVEITTLSISLICFTLRLSNRYLKKIVTFDDFVLTIATCTAISMTAMVWRLYSLGYGLENVPPKNNAPVGAISLALFTIFPMCYSLIRVSIVLTYLKLFPTQTNRWLCWALCGLQIVYSLWAGLVTLLQCKPINSYWDKTIEGWKCHSPRNQDFAILTLNSCFDLIVYTWPARYLYKLNIPWRSRVELIVAFSIGLMNLGLSFARLSLLITMYSTERWFQYGPPGVLIIILESHVGITCASLPYMRFLFDFVSTNYFSKPSYGPSRDPTKLKHSDPNEGHHPFVELDGCSGQPVSGKNGIEISTYREEGSEEDLGVYGGRTRAMEHQMQSDAHAWGVRERPPPVDERDVDHIGVAR